MIIQEILLKKALNIRKEYRSILNNIGKYEIMARNLMESLNKCQIDLEKLQENINSGKISDLNSAKEGILKIMMSLEEEGNNIDITISGMTKRIDKLKEDEVSLHKDIKQRYPDMIDENIRKEIHDYLISKNID